MAQFKKIIERTFLVLVAVVILAQAVSIFLGWREGRRIRREIWENARVAVIKADPRFPPALLLEYENASRWAIERTHFRLTFEVNDQEVARTDRDYGELGPGKKVDILLQSVAAGSAQTPGSRATLRYHLVVYPSNKKPLPEITGEILIK
jgi:hypothetical protein